MPAAWPPGDVWGIDAGGSRTTAVVVADGTETRREFDSISVGTVGMKAAVSVLGKVLDFVRSHLISDGTTFGCIGCSSMPVAMEAPYPDELVKVIESRAPAGAMVFANDMLPLLYAPPIGGVGVVVSSGTGSCVLARNEKGRLAKIGGHEHLISDEGSAYSLGRAALRAAAAGHDGTGPATVLFERVVEHYGMTIPALGRWLAEKRYARASVAGFAPVLLDSADDPVALRIIEHNAEALADAVRVAVDLLALPPGLRVGFSGGVMRGSESYRTLVVQKMAEYVQQPRTFLLDGPDSVRWVAWQLRERPALNRWTARTEPFPGPEEGLYVNVPALVHATESGR
jgi:N-acetylglucosamine kinase-like BadF-type ATPase